MNTNNVSHDFWTPHIRIRRPGREKDDTWFIFCHSNNEKLNAAAIQQVALSWFWIKFKLELSGKTWMNVYSDKKNYPILWCSRLKKCTTLKEKISWWWIRWIIGHFWCEFPSFHYERENWKIAIDLNDSFSKRIFRNQKGKIWKDTGRLLNVVEYRGNKNVCFLLNRSCFFWNANVAPACCAWFFYRFGKLEKRIRFCSIETMTNDNGYSDFWTYQHRSFC